MTKREQVIQFLNCKYESSKSNIVSKGKNDLETIDVAEREVVQTLCLLAEDKIIRIVQRSVSDDLSRYWNVALKGECVDYFEIKREKRKEKRNDWIQFWIPISLSIVAIIVSIIT